MKVNTKQCIKNCQYAIRDVLINRKYRERLMNRSFSLISSDCTGGCWAKDLRVRMNSPTRNFYFNADDYIKFCSNLDYYLELEPLTYRGSYSGEGSQYLMASLGDLKMFLVHYDSIEQARLAWLRRRERVNSENMFFIMNDRNLCTEREIEAFDALPYQNKVCFTHIPYRKYKSTFYIAGSETRACVKGVMNYVKPFCIKRYYDQFDFVDWINSGGCDWR